MDGEDALPNPKESLPASEEALLELLVGTDGVVLAGRSGRWRELGSEVGFEPWGRTWMMIVMVEEWEKRMKVTCEWR